MEKWNEVEKAVNNFIEILQTLPEDLKEKAVNQLNEKLNGSREVKREASREFCAPSHPMPHPSSPIKRKRGRPGAKNGIGVVVESQKQELGTFGVSLRSTRICRKNPKFIDFLCTSGGNDGYPLMKKETKKGSAWKRRQKMEGYDAGTDEKVLDDDDDDDDDDADMRVESFGAVKIEKLKVEISEEVGDKAKESGHLRKKYSCTTCNKKYSTPYTLKEHEKVHKGEPYICDHCGHMFASKTGFRQHQLYHSEESEGLYKCMKCTYVVRSQSLLDEHQRLKHDQNRPKNHVCDSCGKAFYTAGQLERHLLGHMAEKPYKCDECSFETVLPSYLDRHRLNVHAQDDGRQLYRCEICKVILRSKGTYKDHLHRHFKLCRKKCDICQKTFPNASQLAAHKRSHQNPTIPCEFCGKLFRNKHKLQAHLLTHSSKKEFQCPYCSYASYARHNMKKHCMNKHNIFYPPDKTQRVKKFDPLQILNENTIKDPLALECVKKAQLSKTGLKEIDDIDKVMFRSSNLKVSKRSILKPSCTGSEDTIDVTKTVSEILILVEPNRAIDSMGTSSKSKIFIWPLSTEVGGLSRTSNIMPYGQPSEKVFPHHPSTTATTTGIHIRPLMSSTLIQTSAQNTSM